jgi:MFS transporter, PPP family, 3-phenylpropionic acid transporter
MGRERIATFYFLWFSAVGISLPFMAEVLKATGRTEGEIGLLLAASPLCAMIFPPLWGQLADRTARHGRVLAALALGCALGTFGLYFAGGFWAALGAAAFGAVFGSSISTVADAVAVQVAAEGGGSFSRVRVFGSLGFIAAAVSFGAAASSVGRGTLVVVGGLQAASALYAFAALGQRGAQSATRGPSPGFAGMWELLKLPGMKSLLAASALHWVACAPYHGIYAPLVSKAGFPPWVVAASAGIAVTSEVVVMLTWPRWAHRVSVPAVLTASFGVSAVRWVVTAHAGIPMLLALAALHGLTFGAFYIAAVEWMSKRAPDSLRASGQSLFVAATFGLGGVLGYLASGQLWGAVGAPRLFELAGIFELLPLFLALWLWRINRGTLRLKPA